MYDCGLFAQLYGNGGLICHIFVYHFYYEHLINQVNSF